MRFMKARHWREAIFHTKANLMLKVQNSSTWNGTANERASHMCNHCTCIKLFFLSATWVGLYSFSGIIVPFSGTWEELHFFFRDVTRVKLVLNNLDVVVFFPGTSAGLRGFSIKCL